MINSIFSKDPIPFIRKYFSKIFQFTAYLFQKTIFFLSQLRRVQWIREKKDSKSQSFERSK